jgi:hypothetical protein
MQQPETCKSRNISTLAAGHTTPSPLYSRYAPMTLAVCGAVTIRNRAGAAEARN